METQINRGLASSLILIVFIMQQAWEDVSRPQKSNEVRRDQKTEDEREKKEEKDTK